MRTLASSLACSLACPLAAALAAATLVACAAFAVGCAPPVVEPKAAGPLVDLVDPTIGTGGFAFAYGATFLGAAAPHGLVKAGPDTTGSFGETRFVHTSGNWAEDPTILCFSHLHLHGVGLPEGGVVAMMPTTSFDPAKPRAVQYQATRAGEVAHPGSYAVDLVEPAIHVEVTAPAAHSAHWRITYPDGTDHAGLVLDLFRTIVEGTVTEAHYDVAPAGDAHAGRITGSLHTNGGLSPPGGYDVHFVIDVDAAAASGSSPAFTLADTGFGAALDFGARGSSAPVELRVALSYVDVAGAVANLEAEDGAGVGAPSFDDDSARARSAWDALLGRVKLFVPGDDDAAAAKSTTASPAAAHVSAVIFASAVYRSFLMPTQESDVDGRFRGPDGAVYDADDVEPGFRMMTDLSLWDTYRTVQPLYSLVAPKDARDTALSIAEWTRLLGHGPLWPMATGDAAVMIGSPGEVILGDAVARGDVGAHDLVVKEAYDILRAAALDETDPPGGRGGRGDVMQYDAHGGWMPAPFRAPVSATLELAEADTALARIAVALGHDDVGARLVTRSHGWRELFDGDTGFLRGRNDDGAFTIAASAFAPEHFSDDYVEADAWQSMFPIDDVEGVRAVYGGDAGAAARLRDLLDRSEADFATRDPGESTFGIQPLPFHWQGNEPSEHVSALAYELGDDALGAEFVQWVMTTQYGVGVNGIPGNDDGGALSSWWALAALGLHPVAGSSDWVIGAPLFPRVEVGDVVITRSGDAGGAPKKRTLDGAATAARIDHLGSIDVELGAAP